MKPSIVMLVHCTNSGAHRAERMSVSLNRPTDSNAPPPRSVSNCAKGTLSSFLTPGEHEEHCLCRAPRRHKISAGRGSKEWNRE